MKTLYTKGNAAKQWIFEALDERFGQERYSILDLCCGSGMIWHVFLEVHPNAVYRGIDFDRAAIAKGQKIFESFGDRAAIEYGDAQNQQPDSADVVVAFSAIEHVVDRKAFLKTVFSSLRSGGVAYLNYDAGHFRSRNLKERLMVPVSQLLASFGVEGPYMKEVDDAGFNRLAAETGFEILDLRKHNLHTLKGFMRGASDDAVRAWYGFEEELGRLYAPEDLDRIFWSTTLVVKKP